MIESVENAVREGELLTLNEIKGVTGGHYQTIKKIIDRMVADGEIETDFVTRRNREFQAYRLTNLKIAEIQTALKRVKLPYKPVKMSVNDNRVTNENAQDKSVSITSNTLTENDVMKTSVNEANVKLYEVVKQNNELENKVSMLEATIKDKDIELANQKAQLTSENTQLQAELYKAQADVKLITDKSSTMEAAWAEEKLKVESLRKQVSNRNVALMVLGAIILVAMTVIITVLMIK